MIFKRIRFFSLTEDWTFHKELLFDVFILFWIGLSTYFAGFIIEEPGPRWNFPTLLDSLSAAMVLGLFPVFLFTLTNIRYLFTPETEHDFNPASDPADEGSGSLIQIISKAKKENLEFYPDQFIYAESQGNYVIFHLIIEDGVHTKTIRNAISAIEEQFHDIPYFMRIHRAFIVNLRKITSRSGNTLGYRLKLDGTDDTIPVSRQNIKEFDSRMEKLA
jgi:hypothetical protein